MITRRIVLAKRRLLALTASASAEDWKRNIRNLPLRSCQKAENASGVTERWTPFVVSSKELGVKVTLRIANDYAAVIEEASVPAISRSQAYGSASFARARLTGVKTGVRQRHQRRRLDGLLLDVLRQGGEPLQGHRSAQGQEPRPRRSELDLRQQRATSELDKLGIPDADAYFGKVVFTGSHENAMLALSQGTVDVAASGGPATTFPPLAQMLGAC